MNLNYNYIENNKSLYSKIHFTSLKFYEPIKDYKKLKEHIFNKIKEEEKEEKIENMNNHKNEKNDNLNINEGVKKEKNDEVNKAIYFIPKVICFGSLLPFHDELSKILINIYKFYKYQILIYKILLFQYFLFLKNSKLKLLTWGFGPIPIQTS